MPGMRECVCEIYDTCVPDCGICHLNLQLLSRLDGCGILSVRFSMAIHPVFLDTLDRHLVQGPTVCQLVTYSLLMAQRRRAWFQVSLGFLDMLGENAVQHLKACHSYAL